jgi:site-specific recombinase XerD
MRTSDVLGLLLSDIDWHSKEIHFIQKKTGNACTVAFDEATGWAIIDYLKNGRPNIKQYPNVFLQARPPFIPMNSFNVCLQKYVERAGIHYKNNQLHGMHSLRHSLATRMLNNGTSAETISEVLGHINITSTVDYLQVNMDQLRRCALETEVTE